MSPIWALAATTRLRNLTRGLISTPLNTKLLLLIFHDYSPRITTFRQKQLQANKSNEEINQQLQKHQHQPCNNRSGRCLTNITGRPVRPRRCFTPQAAKTGRPKGYTHGMLLKAVAGIPTPRPKKKKNRGRDPKQRQDGARTQQGGK